MEAAGAPEFTADEARAKLASLGPRALALARKAFAPCVCELVVAKYCTILEDGGGVELAASTAARAPAPKREIADLLALVLDEDGAGSTVSAAASALEREPELAARLVETAMRVADLSDEATIALVHEVADAALSRGDGEEEGSTMGTTASVITASFFCAGGVSSRDVDGHFWRLGSMTSRDVEERERAVVALKTAAPRAGPRSCRRAVDVLCGTLLRDRDGDVRAGAAEALVEVAPVAGDESLESAVAVLCNCLERHWEQEKSVMNAATLALVGLDEFAREESAMDAATPVLLRLEAGKRAVASLCVRVGGEGGRWEGRALAACQLASVPLLVRVRHRRVDDLLTRLQDCNVVEDKLAVAVALALLGHYKGWDAPGLGWVASRGVDFDFKPDVVLELPDPHGYIGIQMALHGQPTLAPAVISLRTFGDMADRGHAFVHRAAEDGQADIVSALLGARTTPNLQRSDGATPLLLAAQEGHADIVLELLGARADPELQKSDDATPLLQVREAGHADIVSELQGDVFALSDHQWWSDRGAASFVFPPLPEAVANAVLQSQSYDGATSDVDHPSHHETVAAPAEKEEEKEEGEDAPRHSQFSRCGRCRQVWRLPEPHNGVCPTCHVDVEMVEDVDHLSPHETVAAPAEKEEEEEEFFSCASDLSSSREEVGHSEVEHQSWRIAAEGAVERERTVAALATAAADALSGARLRDIASDIRAGVAEVPAHLASGAVATVKALNSISHPERSVARERVGLLAWELAVLALKLRPEDSGGVELTTGSVARKRDIASLLSFAWVDEDDADSIVSAAASALEREPVLADVLVKSAIRVVDGLRDQEILADLESASDEDDAASIESVGWDMNDVDPDVRQRAVEALIAAAPAAGRRTCRRKLDAVCERLLEDDNGDVRVVCAEALPALATVAGDEKYELAVAKLCTCLKQDEEMSVMRAATRSLVDLGAGDRAAAALCKRISGEGFHWKGRVLAACQLASVPLTVREGDCRVDDLLACLQDASAMEEKLAAAVALTLLGRRAGWAAHGLCCTASPDDKAAVLLGSPAAHGFFAIQVQTDGRPVTSTSTVIAMSLDVFERMGDVGATFLRLAAELGRAGTVSALLGSRADPDLQTTDGATALAVAAQNGNTGVVLELLRGRADLNLPNTDSATPLAVAAKKGHAGVVSMLLEAHPDLNLQTVDCATPLFQAAQHGHIDVVSLLLGASADLGLQTAAGATPLAIAVQNGHNDVVFRLRAVLGLRNGSTPLFKAAQNGHMGVVDLLLQARAALHSQRCNGATPLAIAVQNGHADVISYLWARAGNLDLQARTRIASDGDRATDLHIAAQQGDTPTISSLLEARAAVDHQRGNGATPLFEAAMSGHSHSVSALLDAHADPDLPRAGGAVPLFVAASNGHAQVLSALLGARAALEVRKSGTGDTPLSIAVQEGHAHIVSALAEARADLNTRRHTGATPLDTAARRGDVPTLHALLEACADIDLRTSDGGSPLAIARSLGHAEVANLLEAHAALNREAPPEEERQAIDDFLEQMPFGRYFT